ncbi:MAG: hypothetical protein HQK49_22505 [Oligoflexia bacterium]|nr:hypothetical protein [Oligoflexia bacterium]
MDYCPKCLNNTLVLGDHGVVNLFVNGKHISNARFLFHANDKQEEVLNRTKDCLQVFFKWYSSLQNIVPIEEVDLMTNCFACRSGCVLSAKIQLSVLDILVPRSAMFKIVREVGEKYKLDVRVR